MCVAEIKSEDHGSLVVGHEMSVVLSLRGRMKDIQTKSHIGELDKECLIYRAMSNSN